MGLIEILVAAAALIAGAFGLFIGKSQGKRQGKQEGKAEAQAETNKAAATAAKERTRVEQDVSTSDDAELTERMRPFIRKDD